MNYISQKNSKLHNIGKKITHKTSLSIQNQAKFSKKSSKTPLQRRGEKKLKNLKKLMKSKKLKKLMKQAKTPKM